MKIQPFTIEFVHPAGIGDISWGHSKLRFLPQMTGAELVYSVVDGQPRRGLDYVALLPDVRVGNYLPYPPLHIMTQCVPPRWPYYWGLDPLTNEGKGGRVVVQTNCELEMGVPLADIWPMLPTDYHYPMRISRQDQLTAMHFLKKYAHHTLIGAYVCSAHCLDNPLWDTYTDEQWVELLSEAAKEFERPVFLMIGAEYDRSRTEKIGRMLEARGQYVGHMIAYPLGAVVAVIRELCYFFSYPSGLGVLAGVMRTPCLTFYPSFHAGLQASHACPRCVEQGIWRGWCTPPVSEALDWWKACALKHVRPPLTQREVRLYEVEGLLETRCA